MHVTYPGPSEYVDLHTEPRRRVRRGGQVEVDQELGEQLVAQGWIAETDQPASDRVADVLAWVGTDPARAATALAAEQAKGAQARKSLTGPLAELASPTTTSEED